MGKRLLLVDDEPRNLSVLEAHLAPLGHEILRATDGRAALEIVDARAPDLVLLDVVMPGFDGLDVLTHIRARADGDQVPVILVTAHTEREQRLRGLEAGADDFLEKPIDAPVLLRRVSTLLRLKDSRDALRASHDELAKRNDALQRLQHDQRELTGFVVHDLKNLLAALWANLHFGLTQLPPEENAVREALTDANDAAQRLRTMVEDLLVISRLEEASFPIRVELVGVGELLRGVIHSYVHVAEDKRVILVAPTDVSQVTVVADRGLLQRVLENILDNSLRYTPPNGRVSIQTHAGNDIEICVSNTGPSIAVEDRARIFDKFARGAREMQSRTNAGLGLYFCRRAIEALGGSIEVKQTPEWPTSFVVHLPPPPPAAH